LTSRKEHVTLARINLQEKGGALLTKRYVKDEGFNTSVPDLIAQFREIIEVFSKHPAIPRPWPEWVPSPEILNGRLQHLEQSYGELDPNDGHGARLFNRFRRELKTCMARLLRYVEQTLTGSHYHLPPGFDLGRNPGCSPESPVYGSGLAMTDLPQPEGPKARHRWESSETRNYLVRAVRPMFQAACIEVEARDRADAIDRALSCAARIPEDQWTGRNDPEDYFFDVHCVHSGQTAEGHPFSLLDFPRYTVVSTNPYPAVKAYAVLDPWIKKAGPILTSSLLSDWIDQLWSSQVEIYEDAEENLKEILQQWKGSDDQKVLPHMDPEERRLRIDMIEHLLQGINLMKEPDSW
jgi:hypothetical protein